MSANLVSFLKIPSGLLIQAGIRAVALAVGVSAAGLLFAAGGTSAATVSFVDDVRPILSDKCFTCHGPDEGTRKTAFRLDTAAGAFSPLASGELAIVRGQPQKSELLARVTSDDPVRRMPPSYLGHDKLSAKDIDLLRRWIEQGAPFQSHWAFVPPSKPAIPKIQNKQWAKNEIDHFVLNRLTKEGLDPSPEADRRTLIRRASLDLRGLPPSVAEIEAFLNDSSPDAYERLVDRLLDSPSYGEHMAFRWLNVARYSDTNGYQSDGERQMWRWRDWVIDAFNSNMPFDQFTIEQLAGDLLPNATRDQIIATGFNRNHRTSAEGGIIEEEFRTEYVADRAETVSTVWMGLTIGCARCHDHKYDPLTQKEFYRLFAYFNNVDERGLVYNFGNEEPYIKAPTPEQEARLAHLDARVAETRQAVEAMQRRTEEAQPLWENWVSRSGAADWKPRDGLLLHYPLDGNTRETTGGFSRRTAEVGKKAKAENDDSAVGAVTFAAGKLDDAAQFEEGRYVDGEAGLDLDYLDPFTFSAWVYPESPNGAILSREDDFPKGTGHGLYLRDGKLFLHVTMRWTDISLRVQTEESLDLNQWRHVAVTYDGKRKAKGVHIYVDGKEWTKEVLFDELSFPLSSNEPFRIGAGGGPQNRFRGSIDDVRVYSRAMPPAELRALGEIKTVPEIAAMPVEQRSDVQKDKLRMAFLDQYAPREVQAALRDWREAQFERDEFYDSISTVMVMKEMEAPRETHVLKRGAYDAPGDRVEPGIPAVLGKIPDGYPDNRLGLARWLTDPSNPLTARVTVNRLWQGLFGKGLVKTSENFGSQGALPTHPQLLDWLASDFVNNGWDVKHLLKTILTSATYRQSSKATPEMIEKDPENILLARAPRFRLPGDTIRDQALAVSGLLVEHLGGPSVKPYQPAGLWKELVFGGTDYEPDTGDKLYRRSLYTFWRRTVPPPSMVNFDSPTRETCTVRESRTNTPLQALNLMNDVTFVEASRKLAERMMKDAAPDAASRVRYGFELVTSRLPKQDEQAVLENLLDHFENSFQGDKESAEVLLGVGDSKRDDSLDPVQLASYSAVASLILNTDEAVTKE